MLSYMTRTYDWAPTEYPESHDQYNQMGEVDWNEVFEGYVDHVGVVRSDGR